MISWLTFPFNILLFSRFMNFVYGKAQSRGKRETNEFIIIIVRLKVSNDSPAGSKISSYVIEDRNQKIFFYLSKLHSFWAFEIQIRFHPAFYVPSTEMKRCEKRKENEEYLISVYQICLKNKEKLL